ncbi:MAG TPA: DUF5131 family protein [Isosphaeraceae bacterium]|nr:DUF5131 family protein [Isosphaeraceae bacterium]
MHSFQLGKRGATNTADLKSFNLAGIHWVIAGSESEGGPGARPLEKDWVISIRYPLRWRP